MRKCFLTAGLLLLCASAFAAQQQPARQGPYGRLDPKKLPEVLRSLQMTELLQEVVGQQPAPSGAANVAGGGDLAPADEKVRLAAQTADPAQRQSLLKDAGDIYRKIGEEKARNPADLWNRVFEARLRLADSYRTMAEPVAVRLMYLQGAEEDRKTLATLTEEPVKVLRELRKAVDDTLTDYRQSADKAPLVVYLRTATAMKERINALAAYLELYRGLALPANSPERKTLLNEVISALTPYAEMEDDDENNEGKCRASLLIGIAMRELGQHANASVKLAVAAEQKPGNPVDVRLQALFEIIHNLTEQKKFDQVPGEVESFRKAALAILPPGPQSRLRVDVQAALLLDDMYEDQAAGETDPLRLKTLRVEAQRPLLDFLQKYQNPDISEAFLDVVGAKYRDRADVADLSAIVLVARARTERARHTEPGNTEALKLLDLASDANDPVSAAAAPYVLRESATLLYQMKRPREAGRRFVRIAALSPDANEAFQAALNGTKCFYNVYEDANTDKTLKVGLQDEFLASLELLTGKWGDQADTGPWFFILGRIYSEKALTYGLRSPERVGCYKKAVAALEKTPANLPEAPDARFRALEVRQRLLVEDPKAPDAEAQAQALAAKLKAFADDARKALATAKDKGSIDQWTDWGARAAVGAIQVRYEFLKDQEASLRDLPAVLEEWKASSVAMEAMDWEIRMLVESADPRKIADAIAKVDAFRKQFPKEAEGLIHQVVQRIQDRIRLVRLDPDAKGELERLSKAYKDFSKELYDRSAADPAQAYAARQMYADAMWLSGDGETALKLWQECAKEDEARLAAREKLIDDEINKKIALVTQAARNDRDLERCAQDFLKTLEEKKMAADSGPARGVQDALKAMQQATTPEDHGRRMVALGNKLTEGYKAIAFSLKKQVQVDAMNILGLARSHRMLKQYPDAMKQYNQLGKGIDRQSFGDFYWDVQLELCQTAQEGFATDKEQMKRLAQYIQQLQGEEANMGGKQGLFKQIENEAKKVAGL